MLISPAEFGGSARREESHPARRAKYPPDINDLRSMVAIGEHHPCRPDHAGGNRPPKRSRRSACNPCKRQKALARGVSAAALHMCAGESLYLIYQIYFFIPSISWF